MSAAKMVADSTQGDLATDSVMPNKRRKSHDKKKAKKQKKQVPKKSARRSSSENEGFEDQDDLDLSKDLKPIGSYLKDRQTMLEEMFRCLKGPSLQRNLPDVLKDLPLEDLKRRCMNQLEIMSRKRIQRILAGDDPAVISSSGTDDSSSEEEGQRGKDNDEDLEEENKSGCEEAEDNEADSTSQPRDNDIDSLAEGELVESEDNNEDEEEEENEEDEEVEEYVTEEGVPEEEAEEGELRDEEEGKEMEEDVTDMETEIVQEESYEESAAQMSKESNGHHSDECSGQAKGDNSNWTELSKQQEISQDQELDSGLAPVLTENQMELLELEMRARAIKAMLRAQESREKKLSQ